MPTIYVGYEYKKAFESICRLINEGCLDGHGYEVRGNVIKAGVYEYELSGDAEKYAKEETVGFTDQGASWFGGLRGETVENDNAVWMSFMDTVKRAYHRNFSVVEYEQQAKTSAENKRAREYAEEVVKNIISNFYPMLSQVPELTSVSGSEFTEDIYGISMRIELSAAVTRGAPLPVLCKVYFNKSGRTVVPLTRDSASAIDETIGSIVPNEELSNDGEAVSDDVILNALDAINKLINEPERNYADFTNFADYICFSDEADSLAVESLRRQLSHDNFELECRRVEILYITHIRADSFVFDVSSSGYPLFRMVIGLNNSVTVSCLNCGEEEPLISRNKVSYELEDGKRKTVELDFDAENLGLDEITAEEIRLKSRLAKHFIHIQCPNNPRNSACEMNKCISQLFEIENGGSGFKRCKDCPYPEMVYPDFDGGISYTPLLMFAKDRMALLPRDDETMQRCKGCGRYFTVNVMRNGKCPTCVGADMSHGSTDAKRKYREYRNLLSLGTRIRSGFSAKRCVEDDELVLFVLGNRRYAFNKLNVRDHGTLEKPHRIK